ncbi:MAG TPA: ATP-grasp domain-containing protein [Micropepsaceae bacterium]|nr:ATP-grasp domain-containing protein [Micropepsaceae bacterium]
MSNSNHGRGRLALIYSAIVTGDDEDPALSTDAQANEIEAALHTLGWRTMRMKFDGNMPEHVRLLKKLKPDFVFNLVEAALDTDRLAYLGAAAYETARIPFAGSGSFGLMAASDKIAIKPFLANAGIPVPGFACDPHWEGLKDDRTYIVKSVSEHASAGLDSGAVVKGREAVLARWKASHARIDARWFAEEYIDGREFNIAMLEMEDGPRVMPLAEMTFIDYPADKPRIIDSAAKWQTQSAEYKNTVRRFLDPKAEPDLAKNLTKAARDTWKLLGLGGWVRVDMRVGADNQAYVIDVNVNPDISMDAGMAAAAEMIGLSYVDLIRTIVDAGLRRGSGRA